MMIYLLAICPVLTGIDSIHSAAAAANPSSSPRQATGLVKEGIDFYEKNELEDALQSFESAEIIYPDDEVVPYYLGMLYLQRGERRDAIAQWKRYLELAPEAENAGTIRKYITLLLHKEAEIFARNAVDADAAMKGEPVDGNTVAVTTFKNLGSEKIGPIGKGMAAMIIADLSQLKGLKVVEREKLQALLKELKLGTSGLVDEKSAPKVGRLLRAKHVTSGSMADMEEEGLEIASILFDADLNSPSGFQNIRGKLNQFYELEKKTACSIAEDLGRDCSQAPEAFGVIHTQSLTALSAYSQGLDLIDKENFDEARAEFERALQVDPQFDLAQAALAATPPAAMLLLTEAQMVSKASGGAPAATAAADTAAASTTAAGTGGTGYGTTALIAGGGAVLVGGGIAAVVALSGGDDGGGSSNPSGTIAGSWDGAWNNTAAGENGVMNLELNQNGSSFGGTIEITGTECISRGTITGGRLNSDQIELNISSSTADAGLTANVNKDRTGMRGTLTITSGNCPNTTLQFDISKPGSADVVW